MSNGSPTALLLNADHALDHLFLLIFATADATIATDWGMTWQGLMSYAVGAFFMFGLDSLPAGRLWHRSWRASVWVGRLCGSDRRPRTGRPQEVVHVACDLPA